MINKTVKNIALDTSVTPSLAAYAQFTIRSFIIPFSRTSQGPACKYDFAQVMRHCKARPHRSAKP